MKFAVLGGGSAGQGIAGYLALKGHEINLYNRTPEKIASIARYGNLKVSGVIKGNAKIETASSDMREILRDVDSILVAARAFGHESIIKESLPYIEKNATIVVFTGYWAALRLRSILSREQRNDIAIAETTLLPLASEIVEEGHVKISGIKSKMRIAACPVSRTASVYKKLSSVLPQLFPGNNVLETSLESFNPVLHIPIALFNLAGIEKKDKFEFYHDGISPRVARVIDAIDAERMNLTKKLNLDLIKASEVLREYYETKGSSTYEIIRNCKAYEGYVLPNVFSYVREDLLYGVVPMVSICNLLGISAEASKTLISSWSVVDSVDYWREGVKIDKLGMEGMDREKILELVING